MYITVAKMYLKILYLNNSARENCSMKHNLHSQVLDLLNVLVYKVPEVLSEISEFTKSLQRKAR